MYVLFNFARSFGVFHIVENILENKSPHAPKGATLDILDIVHSIFGQPNKTLRSA